MQNKNTRESAVLYVINAHFESALLTLKRNTRIFPILRRITRFCNEKSGNMRRHPMGAAA
jgi:hypothetical protein